MGLVISVEDWVSLYGTITLTHSGAGSSAVASGYSLDALKTRQLGNVCRITRSGLGSTIIRVDFSQSTTLPFAAGICNLDNQSGDDNTVVFKTFSTATARTTSPEYGSEYERAFQLVRADLHDTPAGSINRLEVWITGGGAPEDLDIGRIWYGPAFQSLRASGREWETGPEDSGGVELSRGGQAYQRVGVVSRTLTVPLPLLEEAEIYGVGGAGSTGSKSTVSLETIAHTAGKTREMLVFQENTANAMRPLYGHFQELPRFRKRAGIYYDTALVFREER